MNTHDDHSFNMPALIRYAVLFTAAISLPFTMQRPGLAQFEFGPVSKTDHINQGPPVGEAEANLSSDLLSALLGLFAATFAVSRTRRKRL